MLSVCTFFVRPLLALPPMTYKISLKSTGEGLQRKRHDEK